MLSAVAERHEPLLLFEVGSWGSSRTVPASAQASLPGRRFMMERWSENNAVRALWLGGGNSGAEPFSAEARQVLLEWWGGVAGKPHVAPMGFGDTA